jgi:chromosome segregation ATPase
MGDTENGQPKPSAEDGVGDTAGNPGDLSAAAGSTARSETPADADDLHGEAVRLSRLSSEMKDCLSNIIRKTRNAAETLDEIQNSLERKKQELKELYAIEACVTSLKALEEEHRVREEKFAALMENRRRQWAEEEDLRRREEEEYGRNLKRRRQQQQQEYERSMIEERSRLRNNMEEELRKILQETRDKQSAREEELQKREQALNGREVECRRLIQELDSLMKRLVERKSRHRQGAFSSLASDSLTRTPSLDRHSGGDPYPDAKESTNRDAGSSVISVRRMLLKADSPGASRIAGGETRDSHPFDNNSSDAP